MNTRISRTLQFLFSHARRHFHTAALASLAVVFMLALMTSSASAVEAPPSFLLKWGMDLSADGALTGPQQVVVDIDGNLVVADSNAHRIQKFTSGGAFITKWGGLGSADGQFMYAAGVASDSSGNVYATDQFNHRVQKFTGTGSFILKFGSKGSGNGQLNLPAGLTLDPAGNVFVVDAGNNRIEKFTNYGMFITSWGSTGSGDGQFNAPLTVATDATGNVYVTDTGNNRVQKFDSNGTFLLKWGSFGNCFAPSVCSDGQFQSPMGITVDPTGNVFVADANSRIQKFDPSGVFLAKWGGVFGFQPGQINAPNGLSADSAGNIYMADLNTYRISKFSPAGSFLGQFGSISNGIGEFVQPRGGAIDASGNLFVVDTGNARIQKFSSNGSFLLKWGSIGTDAGQFGNPSKIAVDASGNVYVPDGNNARIQKFSNSGGFISMWGWGVATGVNAFETCSTPPCLAGIGGRREGQFGGLRGAAIDRDGNLLVAETNNNRVQKFSPTGTFLGMWGWGVQTGAATLEFCTASCRGGTSGNGDGQFNDPEDIAASLSGDVYVADAVNRRVQRFTGGGAFISKWGSNGNGDGQFTNPRGIAVDAAGNVYVVDAAGGNNRVQKFTSSGTFLTKWGSNGYADGQFSGAQGVTVDLSGNVFVIDSRNWRVQKFVNTTTGNNVAVSATSGNTTTTVTFGTVSSAGSTTITTSNIAPPVPSGFQLGSTPTYYNVTSSATFNNASVCINYDPAQYSNPSALTLLHYQNSVWINVTTSNDVPNHTICGNVTSLSPFAIGQDTTAPVITATVSGTSRSNGWYIGSVTVNWNVIDPESGISSSTGCGTTTLTLDTTGTTVTCSATNGVGLVNSNLVTIKIDKTLPVITFVDRTTANANGWNNGDVIVKWSCADTGSAVTNAAISKTVSTEGANQSISATCIDNAGNVSASSTISNINIDKTAPVITGNRTPAANANGWNNTPVTVSFTCADTGSVQSGIDTNTVAGAMLSNEGANQSVTNTGTCTDKANNNAAPAMVSGISIDKTVPVFAACPVAGPFLFNSGAQLVGTISVDANIAGLSASGNVLSGSVDTSSVGSKNVAFTAVDKAGNAVNKTCNYNVIASATIQVEAALHTVGSGTNPGSTKSPLALQLRVFDKALVGSPDPKDYGTTWNSGTGIIPPFALIPAPTVVTIGGGNANQYNILVPASPNALNSGSYLVIGKATVDNQPVYVGSPTDPLSANSVTQKFLQVIKNANGKIIPANTTAVPGSMLLIVEPAYLEFTSDTELLPIVYESVDGAWSDVVQANPPEGFVSTPGALTVDVTTSQLKAVQFTVKDVGSAWTYTKITHRLKHKGQDKVITHNIGMVNKQKKK